VFFVVSAWLVGGLLGCKEGDRGTGATISGTVTKADGAPLSGAIVLLDGYGITCLTDEKGRFTLGPLPLPPGRHTLVASFRAYESGTRSDLDLTENQQLTGVDFTLEEDPDYEPDWIKIEKTVPATGTTLQAGDLIRVEVTARYKLANHSFAKVRFFVQDEKERPLVRFPNDQTVGEGQNLAATVIPVRVPNRDESKVFIAAALLPGGEAQDSVIDYVSFDVRKAGDDVTLPRVELNPTDERDRRKVSVVADVRYRLDTVEAALVRVTVHAAYRHHPAADLVKEEFRMVKKADMAAGTHLFVIPVRLPPECGSVVVRAELVAQPSGNVVDRAAHSPVPVPWELPDDDRPPSATPNQG